MSEQYVTIAEIVNTQGHKGMIRAVIHTDFPERFRKLKEVSILHNRDRFTYHISHTYRYKQFIVIKFEEVQNMNEAEKLKGALIQIPKEDAVQLPEGSYYIFDIIGMRVSNLDGKELGEIVDVIKTKANDVYIVKPKDGKQILIPALKTVVREIDIKNRKMMVELPEGILDI